MIIIDIHELVYIISDLINLFLAGFVFMTLYNWLTNAQMDTYVIGIWSLFANTLIKAFYSMIHSWVLVKVDFNESLKILVYVFTAIGLAFAAVKVRESDKVKALLGKLDKKTVHKDILADVVDHKKRTMMIVYPKESNVYYIGVFRLHEEKGADSFITLIEYCLCNKDNDKIIRDYSAQKSSVIINLQNVERIELFYEEDSTVWEWLNKYNKTET